MNTDIYAARGCTCTVTVTPKFADGTVYTLDNSDKIRLTVVAGDKAVIRKESTSSFQTTNGAVVIVIEPEDTAALPATSYGFDVVLLLGGSDPVELIPPSQFRLFETYHDYAKENE